MQGEEERVRDFRRPPLPSLSLWDRGGIAAPAGGMPYQGPSREERTGSRRRASRRDDAGVRTRRWPRGLLPTSVAL